MGAAESNSVTNMGREEIKAFFEDYYENHMWITENQRMLLDRILNSGAEFSVDRLKQALEQEDGSVMRFKGWFFKNMAWPKAIRNYYRFNSLFFPIGKECEIEILGKYNYLRLAGVWRLR